MNHVGGHQNRINGSTVIAILLDGGDFAYWWSCTGKGLCLQPAQQACFSSDSYLKAFLFHIVSCISFSILLFSVP